MDLIYADKTGKELGVLKEYQFDLAYGSSENNFALTMNLEEHCMEQNYRLTIINHADGREVATEYGGIVDAIEVDTESEQVIYTGRTWQGIIENRMVEDDEDGDCIVFSGDANRCIQELVDILQLGDLFVVEQEESGIDIASHEMKKYAGAYSGLVKMLADAGAKLRIRYRQKMVCLSAELSMDYSEEACHDDAGITVKRIYNGVNHIICVGDDNKDRYIIHLFTDENGGIQHYLKDEEKIPVQDSDYIPDKSQQKIYGSEEITETRTYQSVRAVENYILVETQPVDWRKTYSEYYVYEEDDDKYEEVEEETEDVMTLLSSKPDGWSTDYAEYYQKRITNAKEQYISAESKEAVSYKKITKKPKKWKQTYNTYYLYVSEEGLGMSYQPVQAKRVQKYKLQTEKPTNWSTNYTQYYKRKKKGGYEQLSKKDYKKAPKWKKGKFYTKVSVEKAPDFPKVVYAKSVTQTAPDFEINKYYKKTEKVIIPAFSKNKYYRKVYDHYAEMIEDSISYIDSTRLNGDEIQMELDNDVEYDIGDYVGATEQTTGISIIQPISKKIVKIDGSLETVTIEYEIGNKE